MSDGTAVFACALLGGTTHCFGCFVIVSHVFCGLRGLLSYRGALSCWWDEVGVDGWSDSDGRAAFTCV